MGQKCTRLHMSCSLDLHKNAVFAGLWKTIGERDFAAHGAAHTCHAALITLVTGKIHCSHRYRAGGMYVREDGTITADDGSVSRHAHVVFQIGGGFAVLVLYAKTEADGLVGLQALTFPFPHHSVTIREWGHGV